ncbi:hypothetical protein GA0070563_112197 [Micromonospora carbonacea]|uniref:Uncharacterized protein n=1 Tax=Micromonospora carbonacea TaxID=47853 RepID=A0A1C5AD49_9ACTN|nr:hypothetical protein GA0070563_112197 [Micromonospora carbonacea]
MTALVLRIRTPHRTRDIPIAPVEVAEARAWIAGSTDRWESLAVGTREIVDAGFSSTAREG